MIRKLKLWWYLREARLAYRSYHATAEDYDCGRGLLLEVSGLAMRAARRHDNAMFRLRDLGPQNFPTAWEPIMGWDCYFEYCDHQGVSSNNEYIPREGS